MTTSTALVIDLRSRELEAFTASITSLPSGRLVVRKATELGRLKDLPDGELGLPVLVLGAYSAQSSCGFSEVFTPEFASGHHKMAGGCGLGYMSRHPETGIPMRKGDALRSLTNKKGEDFSLWYIPEPMLRKLKGAGNSNVATADAAIAGHKLFARMHKEFVIVEGQSDWANAWSLKPKKEGVFRPEFPVEHRPEVFRETIVSPEEGGGTISLPVVDPNDEFVEVDESQA